jgi:hypothetical protein
MRSNRRLVRPSRQGLLRQAAILFPAAVTSIQFLPNSDDDYGQRREVADEERDRDYSKATEMARGSSRRENAGSERCLMVVSVRVESRARIAFQEDEGVWCGSGIGEFSAFFDVPLGFSNGIFAHPLVPSSPSVQIPRHHLLPHAPPASIPALSLALTLALQQGNEPMTEIKTENASYSREVALVRSSFGGPAAVRI